MDKYARGKVLGKGSFGCAVLVTSKIDGKSYVIKEVDMSRMPATEKEAAQQEAKLLMALNHPNIVRCTECFTHQNKLCIVMDWCSEGDLYSIMQKRKGQQLPEDTVLDWFVQMCLGLKHVHDRKILHRDIKTQNVFMSSGGLLKLGDFGVSKVLNSTWQLAATAVGTPYYLSPEICQNKRYNQKSDIWSLGCVLYEMATLRHAFEAPNMRALVQKIIKGQYTPVPSTHSKELRDLIQSMLTLDWQKRPSVNDILSTPVMKARIQKWLSATLRANEFSHTIIHGKPKPGQLVVQSPPSALPASAFNNAPAAVAGAAAASKVPSGAAPAAPGPAAVAPQRSGVPASAAMRAAAAAPAPFKAPSPCGMAAALPAAAAPKMSPPGSRPASAGGRKSPSPIVGLAAAARGQDAAALARQRALQGQQEREDAAAAALAVKRREEEERQRRELAAVQAQREIERMKLEEQRKRIELERQRLDLECRQVKARRAEEERKARMLQEHQRRAAADEEHKHREVEARRKKAEEEAQRREAERQAKERERVEMREKMAAQKREYQERQRAVQNNKAAVQEQLGVVEKAAAPAAAAAAPAEPVAAGRAAAANRPRKQWSPVRVAPDDGQAAASEERAGEQPARAGVELTAEQRRAAWEEMRAAAERNRRQVHNADQQGGGLAAFLGVPGGAAAAASGDQQRRSPQQPHVNGHDRAIAKGNALLPEERRQVYLDQKAAAERNRWQVEGEHKAVTVAQPNQEGDPYKRKKKKLEEDRLRREQEIIAFQRQHWREMREAAERNKRQLLLGDAGPNPRAPSPQPQRQQGDEAQAPANEELEFAAMVKDMQDILINDGQHAQHPPGAAPGNGALDIDDGDDGIDGSAALAGKFLLNGVEVQLPVHEDDSLALKVEALRMFLEEKLGTKAFLRVYHRLESLSMDDDEAEVSREFLAVLGQEKLPYLQLVHQLIVCEEGMQMVT